MRTPFAISRSTRLLGATLALALVAAPAHAADTPFAPRFAQTARGDVTAVGNTSMTCPAAAANCAAAQGGAAYSNNDFTMAYVDADADATTTLDSSAAAVTLPAGSTVLWAGLYWSGHSSSVNRGKVQFKAPGAGSYTQLTAAPADVLSSTTQAARYRAFRDVTAQVAAAGGGTYWVGDVQSTTGTDRFAGWALFVAYRDSAQPVRRLNVYDGLGTVDSTHTFQTTIAPFHTPATGTVTTKAGLLTFEGDAGIASETASFNGHALSDALNPVGNVMNSTIEAGGANFTAKTPNYANQLGMDLDVYANPGALANDQSSASLAFSSTNEYFMPSAFFLVSDEGPATSTGAGPTVGAPGGGVAHDGETLSADPGTWNGTGTLTYAYQWQRCDANGANCVDIPGATASHYTPTGADVGHTVRVVVTATNEAGTSTPTASTPVAIKASSAPVSATPPVLSGPAAQGHPLTADPGNWSVPGPATYTYQWQRCDANGANCVDIAGATDDTYTPSAADVGHTLRAEITATNDAGATSTTTTPSAPVQAASDPGDLAGVAGGLIDQTSCQQLVGGAKYRRVALAGIGTVRVRAYTTGPALRSSPLRLTTEVTGGKAKRVSYQLDGRAIGAANDPRHSATLTPAQLGKVGLHTLRTAVRGRRGAAKTVALTLQTEPCQTLFTAQRWRTTAGAGLRLRVDSRTALTQVSFKVPAALLPARGAKRRAAGSIRLYVGGQAKPLRYKLWLPKKGAAPRMLAGAGKPSVGFRKGRLRVTGLPLRTAAAEVTLHRVSKLDHPTSPRTYAVSARITREGAAAAETLAARPKPPR
jgi:Ig domain of plant-specific actin-binding protein